MHSPFSTLVRSLPCLGFSKTGWCWGCPISLAGSLQDLSKSAPSPHGAVLEKKPSLVSTGCKGNSQGQGCDSAADTSHSTSPHKPDVEVKGNTALYSEFLSSRLLKNALFCRGRIRRVILHQLTVKKPENNTILSKGFSASQTRSASIDRQGPTSPTPATWKRRDEELWLRMPGKPTNNA